MTKRELIPTAMRTEFGDVWEDSSFHDTAGANRDYTYVPGYSDLRRQRDAAIAKEMDIAQGNHARVNWKNVPTLPVRLQWVRTTKVISGAPDNTKEIDAGSNGYRKVTKEDVGQPWMTALPQGVTILADGSLQKGDTVLMMCDAKQAARNAAINQREISRLTKNTATAGQTEVTVESAPADHQIAAPKPLRKSS